MMAVGMKQVFVLVSMLVTVSGLLQDKNMTKPLRMITLLEPPFVMKDPKTGHFHGFFVDVLDALDVKLDHIDTVVGDKYGMVDHTGSWDGLIGDLIDDKADIAVAPFSIRSKRMKAVTFTQPIIHAGYMVLYKTPSDDLIRSGTRGMWTLLQPFSPGLWCTIVVMALLTRIVFYLINRFNPYEVPVHSKGGPCQPLSFLLGPDIGKMSQSLAGRLLSIMWKLFALVTFSAYMAGLVVILFKTKAHFHALPFDTVEEMVKQKEVDVLCVKNSPTYNYISNHTGYWESKVYKMWKANWDRLMVDSMETALTMMMESDGKYAIFMDEATADYLASTEPCDKMVIGEPVGDQRFGIVCRKESNLCDQLNPGILHLQETGQMEKLREKWFWGGCHKSVEVFYDKQPFIDTFDFAQDSVVPLAMTLRRFSSVFIFMVIGLTVTIAVLVLEVAHSRRKGNVLYFANTGREGDLQTLHNDYNTPRDA